jgi:RNA polymerase sigma factor (sigma-70 family)
MSSPDTQDALVLEHMDLVRLLVGQFYRPVRGGIERDDLMQAGHIGLIKAAARFDASQGGSFRTFAHWRVSGAIIDEVRRGKGRIRKDGTFRRLDVEPLSAWHMEHIYTEAPPVDLLVHRWLLTHVRALPRTLQRILRDYYVKDKTFTEIAHDLGVTKANVVYQKDRAMALLRQEAMREGVTA